MHHQHRGIRLRSMYEQSKIGLLAVDEALQGNSLFFLGVSCALLGKAHCILEWGGDFRPVSYCSLPFPLPLPLPCTGQSTEILNTSEKIIQMFRSWRRWLGLGMSGLRWLAFLDLARRGILCGCRCLRLTALGTPAVEDGRRARILLVQSGV